MAPDEEGRPAGPRRTDTLRPCPVCGRRPAEPSWRPFCSARCRQVDLGRWLAGDYVVPGEEGGAPAEEEKPG